jgi:hypothetical protein
MKSEDSIHCELWKLIENFRLPGVLIWHTPNGQKRGFREQSTAKAMGMLAGVPDLAYVAKFTVGFLELKREDGIISDAQLDFMSKARFQGIDVDVAYSVIGAAKILQARGVIDPSIKFISSDESTAIRRAQGRTAKAKTVRPTSGYGPSLRELPGGHTLLTER